MVPSTSNMALDFIYHQDTATNRAMIWFEDQTAKTATPIVIFIAVYSGVGTIPELAQDSHPNSFSRITICEGYPYPGSTVVISLQELGPIKHQSIL